MAIFSLLTTFSAAFAWFTAQRQVDNDGDNFEIDVVKTSVKKITVHEFFGQTQDGTAYTFDPNGAIAYDPALAGTTGYDSRGFYTANSYIRLHEYSLESPNHPVLLMFEVKGLNQRIDLSTDFTFLGNSKSDFIKTQVSKKPDLNALNLGNYTAGDYFEVLSDESYDPSTKPSTLYYYDGSSLVLATIDTFAGLDVSANRVANRYTKVLADEEHGGVSTIYQYDAVKSVFTMKWIDLGDYDYGKTNPLSSAVKFNSFKIFSEDADELSDLITTKDIVKETANSNGVITNISNQSGVSCLPVSRSLIIDANKKSFTNFTNSDNHSYSQEINIFNDSVSDTSFIGVVINYDYYALEYIFSNNLGHSALNSGLQFVCDWTTKI